VHDRFVQMVVELEAVRGRAVAKGSRGCGHALAHAHDRAGPLRSLGEDFRGDDARPRFGASEQRTADGIEHTVLRCGDDARRQALELEAVQKLEELARRCHPSSSA